MPQFNSIVSIISYLSFLAPYYFHHNSLILIDSSCFLLGMHMYVGSQWFTLPHHVVQWLLQDPLPYHYESYARHVVVADENYFAFSITCFNLQHLFLLIGLVSAIRTRSPGPHSFFSSCTMNFVVSFINFPYLACFTLRSTATTMLLFILVLTTKPVLSLRKLRFSVVVFSIVLIMLDFLLVQISDVWSVLYRSSLFHDV